MEPLFPSSPLRISLSERERGGCKAEKLDRAFGNPTWKEGEMEFTVEQRGVAVIPLPGLWLGLQMDTTEDKGKPEMD